MTKTVRSRFNHEVGQQVAGCTILEKRVIIPPEPLARRLGVYDYLVEAPPEVAKPARAATKSSVGQSKRSAAGQSQRAYSAQSQATFTRATPDEMGGKLIRRIPSR